MSNMILHTIDLFIWIPGNVNENIIAKAKFVTVQSNPASMYDKIFYSIFHMSKIYLFHNMMVLFLGPMSSIYQVTYCLLGWHKIFFSYIKKLGKSDKKILRHVENFF